MEWEGEKRGVLGEEGFSKERLLQRVGLLFFYFFIYLFFSFSPFPSPSLGKLMNITWSDETFSKLETQTPLDSSDIVDMTERIKTFKKVKKKKKKKGEKREKKGGITSS